MIVCIIPVCSPEINSFCSFVVRICTDVENLYDDICEEKERISKISREERDQLIKHYFDLVLKFGFKQENVKEAFYNRSNIVDEHKRCGYSTGEGFLKYLNYLKEN